MTKKDYILIAATLRVVIADAVALDAKRIAIDLADAFADANPKFDRDRFLNACGVAS